MSTKVKPDWKISHMAGRVHHNRVPGVNDSVQSTSKPNSRFGSGREHSYPFRLNAADPRPGGTLTVSSTAKGRGAQLSDPFILNSLPASADADAARGCPIHHLPCVAAGPDELLPLMSPIAPAA